MKKRVRNIAVTLALGIIALLLYMPMNNSCILNFDRSVKPAHLAGPDESPFGLVACDDFDDPMPRWLLASILPALLCAVGAASAYIAGKRWVLIGGLSSAAAMALSFLVGCLIYPWIDAYWMSALDLVSAVPVAFLYGAAGGWLSSKKA